MEHASEFERVLDAELAGAAFRVPAIDPVLDTRPNPAIRFAMWGGGVPPLTFDERGFRPARPHGVSPWETTDARPPFPFDAQRNVFSPTVRASATAPAGAAADGASDGSPAASVQQPAPTPGRTRGRIARVKRQLSAAERTSLDVLRRSGAAALPDDFTAEELKAAYRHLAFRFHPDQHPGADAAKRLELGRRFAQVHAAYRGLAGR